MKVIEFVNNMNKKSVVKTQRLLELKRYYLSMYRANMVKLYDMGYISDPTRFERKEIFTVVEELGLKSMFSTLGGIVLTTEQVNYSLHKNKEDEEKVEFLSVLYDILKYREYSSAIDDFYDSNGFAEGNKQTVSIGLRQKCAKIESRTDYGVSRAIIACFIPSTSTTVELNFNEVIWNLAMKELGVSEGEWCSDGLIDKDLTHKEEVDCIKLLLEGSVLPTGKYASQFKDWLFDHKWKERGMTNVCKGLYSYVFSSYSEEVLGTLSKILNENNDKGTPVLAVQDSYYYIEKPIENFNYPVGCFVVASSEEDEILFDGSVMCGYTGEVYPLDYLQSEGINYVGCPIELNVTFKDKDLFYDIEQVDTKTETWFKSSGTVWYFYEEDEEIPTKKNSLKDGSLELELYGIYQDSLKGHIVGKISSITGLEAARKSVMKVIG